MPTIFNVLQVAEREKKIAAKERLIEVKERVIAERDDVVKQLQDQLSEQSKLMEQMQQSIAAAAEGANPADRDDPQVTLRSNMCTTKGAVDYACCDVI